MNIANNTKVLLAMSVIRLVLAVHILTDNQYTSLSATVKFLIVVVALDALDCDVPLRVLNLYDDPHFCKTLEYQVTDKLVDSITYTIMVRWVREQNIIPKHQYNIVSMLLVYRLIGVLVMFVTRQPRVLCYFPNLFEVVLLVFISSHEFKLSHSVQTVLLVISMGAKMVQEYFLHYHRVLR